MCGPQVCLCACACVCVCVCVWEGVTNPMRRTSGYVFPGVLWLQPLPVCVCVCVCFSISLVQCVRPLYSLARLGFLFPQTFRHNLSDLWDWDDRQPLLCPGAAGGGYTSTHMVSPELNNKQFSQNMHCQCVFLEVQVVPACVINRLCWPKHCNDHFIRVVKVLLGNFCCLWK